MFVTLIRTTGGEMGEFIEFGTTSGPIGLISGLFCLSALGLFAIFQTGPSDDDDSNGGGGGGLMQPIS